MSQSSAIIKEPFLDEVNSPSKPASDFLQSMTFKTLLNLCYNFKEHHYHWPRHDSTEAQFIESGVNGAAEHGISGRSISALLLNGSPALNGDRHYEELKLRTLVDGLAGVSISALEPSYRLSMDDKTLQRVLNSVEVDVLRTHALSDKRHTHVWMRLPVELYEKIDAAAGNVRSELSQRDMAFTLRVPGQGDLQDYIDRTSMIYGSELATLDNHYYLQLHENNRLSINYQKITGGRFIGEIKQFFAFEEGIDHAEVLCKLQGGQKINAQKETQFFATPQPIAQSLCEAAGPIRGLRVLEPSAGDGAIADIAKEMGAAEIVTIESYNVNAIKLRSKGYSPIEKDFLQVKPDDIGQFDVIVANPPFSKNQDIDHVMHMLHFLKPGGSLSVIMSTAWLDGLQKKHQEFIDCIATHGVTPINIKAGAFSESGTSVATVRLDFKDFQPGLHLVEPQQGVKTRRMKI